MIRLDEIDPRWVIDRGMGNDWVLYVPGTDMTVAPAFRAVLDADAELLDAGHSWADYCSCTCEGYSPDRAYVEAWCSRFDDLLQPRHVHRRGLTVGAHSAQRCSYRAVLASDRSAAQYSEARLSGQGKWRVRTDVTGYDAPQVAFDVKVHQDDIHAFGATWGRLTFDAVVTALDPSGDVCAAAGAYGHLSLSSAYTALRAVLDAPVIVTPQPEQSVEVPA